MMSRTFLAFLVGALSTLAGAAHAFEVSENLRLHGYGDVGHVRSNAQAAEAGESAEKSTTYNLSLVANWRLGEQTSVWAQVFQSHDPARPRIDWAFVDHMATNGLRWRAGQVRMPFGLHNEFRDVQALRPSATLPLLYDEELGLIDESFYGVSVEADHRLDTGAVSYEIYAAGALLPGGDRTAYGQALGARVVYETTIDGLSLSWSGYGARLDPERTGEKQSKRAQAVSLRWKATSWDLQAETSRAFRYDRTHRADYLQGSWIANEHWEWVMRAERAATRPIGGESVTERRNVLGVAWRLNYNFGVRFEQRWHRGDAADGADGEGASRWRSSVLSVNYRF
jgi:hypothetical protein